MLAAIRSALDGGLPAVLATCGSDGIANVTDVWQVYFVDDRHVALAFPFIDKTHDNIHCNPWAAIQITDPLDGSVYRLAAEYTRSIADGPLLRSMQAKLAGMASHAGMAGVFELRGADIYRVETVERLPGIVTAPPPVQRGCLAGLRALAEHLAGASDLSHALDWTLEGLTAILGPHHALILCVDESGRWLYTVSSRGYEKSGVGSEVMLGDGVIGTCAQYRVPIRLSNLGVDFGYGRAMRAQALQDGLLAVDTEIPFPGLAEPQSQLAVPIEAGAWLAGVLYVESPLQRCFDHDSEDALCVVAAQLAVTMRQLIRHAEVAANPPAPAALARVKQGGPVSVRYFAATQSVFLGEDYLIKGVAGAVLWLLLSDHHNTGRSDFTNRELRLDTRLRLPEIDDNLETRLILLQRRLAERCDWLALEKLGRGRFRLRLDRPINLHDIEHDERRANGRESAA